MSVRKELAVVSLCSLVFFAVNPLAGTSAMAASYQWDLQAIDANSFEHLTSVPLGSLSGDTGAAKIESTVLAGSYAWSDKYVYTYKVTGQNIFAFSFDLSRQYIERHGKVFDFFTLATTLVQTQQDQTEL